MAYIKNTWVDQQVERPRTYQFNSNPDGSTTLIDDFGKVTELGTPVNADNLNHIEDGIAGVAIRIHNMTEVFAKDEWVKSGDKLYKSKQDQNKGHAVTEPEWYSEVSLGGGLPVGTIFSSTASASHVHENSLPCDGHEYAQAQFKTLYNDWLVGKRLETCTYEQYQQEIATNGACAKFGIDTAKGMFKVPLIPDGYYIKKGQGTANKAGLPNITGEVQFEAGGSVQNAKGAFKIGEVQRNYANLSGSASRGIAGFDASLSNPIYGASNTVETNAVAYRYFVVVATGSIKQSEMDWSAWASALAGKANTDLANTTPKLADSFMDKLLVDYTAGIDIKSSLPLTNKTYPFPVRLFLNKGENAKIEAYGFYLKIANLNFAVYANYYSGNSTFFDIPSNTPFSLSTKGNILPADKAIIFPLKGAN